MQVFISCTSHDNQSEGGRDVKWLNLPDFPSLLKMRGRGKCLKNGITHPFLGSGGGEKDVKVSDFPDFTSLS